jgi:hypothetical protein
LTIFIENKTGFNIEIRSKPIITGTLDYSIDWKSRIQQIMITRRVRGRREPCRGSRILPLIGNKNLIKGGNDDQNEIIFWKNLPGGRKP